MYFFLCVAFFFAVCNAQEETKIEDLSYICLTRNGYVKLEGSCDAYIECMDYRSSRMLCPDGLNFNLKAKWPMYPCSYPADVPCLSRDTSQPPKPTGDCPRQHGFFSSPLNTADDCGQYRLCSEGHAYDMRCPLGLAFDIVRARCNWADLVPGCNSKDLSEFTCPAPEYDLKGNSLISNYRYKNDCQLFYSCQSGRARLLSCDPGFAFDTGLGRCAEAEFVKCMSDLNDEDVANNDENE